MARKAFSMNMLRILRNSVSFFISVGHLGGGGGGGGGETTAGCGTQTALTCCLISEDYFKALLPVLYSTFKYSRTRVPRKYRNGIFIFSSTLTECLVKLWIIHYFSMFFSVNHICS